MYYVFIHKCVYACEFARIMQDNIHVCEFMVHVCVCKQLFVSSRQAKRAFNQDL